MPRPERGLAALVPDRRWGGPSPDRRLRPPPETMRREAAVILVARTRRCGLCPFNRTAVGFRDGKQTGQSKGYEFRLRPVAMHLSDICEGRDWPSGPAPVVLGRADTNGPFN
jgi:lysozyme